MHPTSNTTLPRGFRIWRRWGGPWRFQFRRSARIEARGWLLPFGASGKFRREECEDALPQTSDRRAGEVGNLERLGIWNTQLVTGASDGSWSGQPQKVGTWGMGLFLTPTKGEWTMLSREWPPGPTSTAVCLHQKNFLLLPDSIFACWDIQEIQQEKTVAYAQTLQFWVEKADLPTAGKPCLLAWSIVELWEEMKCYISFSDEDVFSGMALPEEPPVTSPKKAMPKGTWPILADPPVKEVTVDVSMEPPAEKKPPNQFPDWEKVLHPFRPIVAAGQIPPLSSGPKWRPHSQSLGERLVQCP